MSLLVETSSTFIGLLLSMLTILPEATLAFSSNIPAEINGWLIAALLSLNVIGMPDAIMSEGDINSRYFNSQVSVIGFPALSTRLLAVIIILVPFAEVIVVVEIGLMVNDSNATSTLLNGGLTAFVFFSTTPLVIVSFF